MASIRTRAPPMPMVVLPPEGDVEQDVDFALGARVFNTAPFIATTPLQNKRVMQKLPPVGAWWSSQQAVALRAQLDDAVRAKMTEKPSLCGSHALDLLAFPHHTPASSDTGRVRARVAFASTADDADAPADEWTELDAICPPAAVVLQHRFALAGSRTLTLRTLIFNQQAAMAPGGAMFCSRREYERVAFRGVARIAVQLTPHEQRAAEADPDAIIPPVCAVALDGAWLDAAALSALPLRERDAIKAARRAQMLHALRACIDGANPWAGGLLMLRTRMAPLLSRAGGVALQELAAAVTLARAGGKQSNELRRIRRDLAETFMALDQPQRAAALLRENEAARARAPSGSILHAGSNPLDAWADAKGLGKALFAAGDYAASEAACERSLACIRGTPSVSGAALLRDAKRRDPDDWRSDHRLQSLHALLVNARMRTKGDEAAFLAALRPIALRMFERHIVAACERDGCDDGACLFSYDCAGTVVTCEVKQSGVRFEMRYEVNEAGVEERYYIVELPRGAPGTASQSASSQRQIPKWMTKMVEAHEAGGRSLAEVTLKASHQAFKLGPLPPAQCAQCGAVAPSNKRCAGCLQVAYCDPQCQRSHWAVHKKECRAADGAPA